MLAAHVAERVLFRWLISCKTDLKPTTTIKTRPWSACRPGNSREMVKKLTTARKTQSAKPQAASHASSAQSQLVATSALNVKEQQRLLNIFSDGFKNVLSADSFPVMLQEIKQALFNRDFAAAFGREDYLQAYAARWSPTRTLCYATVLAGIDEYLEQITFLEDEDSMDTGERSWVSNDRASGEPGQVVDEMATLKLGEPATGKKLKLLSIGGCAAEHVAFASYLQQAGSRGNLTLLDSGPWSQVVSLLQTQITTPPELSKYASAAARASNTALLSEEQLSTDFVQHDVLSLETDKLHNLVGARPLAVTLLFTLNELYTSSGIGKTTKFLRTLGEVLPGGSLLLVVDSPGSYSEAAVGKEKKRYPMQWLLDHTLLEAQTKDYSWERLESEDSVWFRLPEGLSYPIQLENMRYQMHLYRIYKDT